MGRRRVLFISNGHGEDLLAGVLARALHTQRRELDIWAFPVVGEGKAYREFPVIIKGVQKEMPSGGWIRQSWQALIEDVKAGFLQLTWQQFGALKRLSPDVDLVIPVGDIYPLFLAFWFVRRPIVFVPTAKSEYIHGHFAVEKLLMRRYCRLVLPRDEVTAAGLRQAGVSARYLGNLMMDAIPPVHPGPDIRALLQADCLEESSVCPTGPVPDHENESRRSLVLSGRLDGKLAVSESGEGPERLSSRPGNDPDRKPHLPEESQDQVIIGILPGSRQEAYKNMSLISRSLDLIAARRGNISFAVALAGNLSLPAAAEVFRREGWQPGKEGSCHHEFSTCAGQLPSSRTTSSGAGNRTKDEILLHKNGCKLLLARGRFGDILRASKVIIGMAGTANEQAAGLGRPVVAFPGPGPQFTAGFLKAQKRLLGKALAATDGPEAAAREVLAILADFHRYEDMAAAGRRRMGEPGAASRMAEAILRVLDEVIAGNDG